MEGGLALNRGDRFDILAGGVADGVCGGGDVCEVGGGRGKMGQRGEGVNESG